MLKIIGFPIFLSLIDKILLKIPETPWLFQKDIFVNVFPTSIPLGHHTLGIECKDVLSTGVDRMLVGNRVGVGLTRSTISSFAPI